MAFALLTAHPGYYARIREACYSILLSVAAFPLAFAAVPWQKQDEEVSMFCDIDEQILVSPQIAATDVATAKALGVTLIVNNRPDGEAPDEPQGAEIAAAAAAAGLRYIAIPVGHGGFSEPQVDAMAAALEAAEGRVLAYCRSGTRSTLLWALACAKLGDDPAALQDKAVAAGYDLSPVRALADMLAARA
jgi:uncharacterized protein (TIGR01244 family)